jgi:hypothetical protein
MNHTITLLELILLSAAIIVVYALIKTIIKTIKTK